MKKLAALTCVLIACGCSSKPPANRAAAPAAPAAPARPAEDPPAKAAAAASLYDRLGGAGPLAAVIDEFVRRLAADARITRRFWDTDTPIPLFRMNVRAPA